MGVKISHIAARSGVPASTIRYYVKEGLLPSPARKNKSMSYYDESCIDKLMAIRHLQEQRYFPLSVIKNILKRMDEGLSLAEAEAIEDVVFGTRAESPVDLKDFMELTGLDREDVREAEELGLLMPMITDKSRKLYDHDDVRFGREVLKGLRELGTPFEGLDFYVKLGRQIMEHEADFRRQAVKGRTKSENIRITTEISRMAEFIRAYILKRLFQHMIQDKIQKSLAIQP